MSDRPARQSTSHLVTKSLSSYLIACAHEPTVGLYFIEDHVKVTTPTLLETDSQLTHTKDRLESALLDIEKTLHDVKEVGDLTQSWSPYMITMLQETLERVESIKGKNK